jgi:Flp pilus assembly protein TadD
MQWGKNAEAEKMYRHALELDSANIYAHYNLSLLLSETGRKEEADSELKKANDLEHGMIDK